MTLFYDDCKNFPQLAQYIRARSPEEFLSQVALGYVVEVSPIVKSTLPLAKKYDAKPEELEKLKEVFCYASGRQEEDALSVYDFALHLMEHLDSYEQAYGLFADDWSQLTFFQMILFRLLPYTGTHLDKMRSDSFLYFRKELLEESTQGVLVDVGAYLGVSPVQYIQSYGESYQKLYLFEPNPVSMERCKERTSALPNVVYSSTALSDETGTGYLSLKDGFSHLHPTQGEEVRVDTLDCAVTEPITFLKVSVAGGELDVLRGAKEHLTKDKPKVAVTLSHVASHLFQIPLYLKEQNPEQTFYLRYHGVKDSTVGFVLYGKPVASSHAPVTTATDMDAKLQAAIATLTALASGGTATPTATQTIPPTSDLDAQLNAAMASLGGTAVPATPVTPSAPTSDLDAQLNAAIASLGGTAVPATPVTPSAPTSDLDAQLNAAIASLGGTAVPATPVTPSAPTSDLDAQLNAAIASLGGTAAPATPVTPSAPTSDLDAQLNAAIASLGGAPVPATPVTPSPANPVASVPVSALDRQLQAMQSKLSSMSTTLSKVSQQASGEDLQLEHGNFKVKSNTKGLSFSKVERETIKEEVPTLRPQVPVQPPVSSDPRLGKRTQNALDLIETMTEGVVYLRSTCESDSPEFHSIMESLQLSLEALTRNIKE